MVPAVKYDTTKVLLLALLVPVLLLTSAHAVDEASAAVAVDDVNKIEIAENGDGEANKIEASTSPDNHADDVTDAKHDNLDGADGNVELLYNQGVDAYLENRFDDCVTYLERALRSYRLYVANLAMCRLRCHRAGAEADLFAGPDIENLRFYERMVRTTLCILQCRAETMATRPGSVAPAGSIANKDADKSCSTSSGATCEKEPGEQNAEDVNETFNVSTEMEALFEARKPYEYLHMCYYKTGRLKKLASAVFTYLVAHPDDEIMQASLKHYKELPGFDISNVINFEAKDYVYLFTHGVTAYENEDWHGVVNNLEESLISYLEAEDECRVMCEGPFDQEWFLDFVPSISNHFAYCLRCKKKCEAKLSNVNGDIRDDLLESHYHYLQYAYFRIGKLQEACQAVESYLLFHPFDGTMLSNKKFYSGLPKVNDGFFEARIEAVNYVYRKNFEDKILKFMFDEFKTMSKPTVVRQIRKSPLRLLVENFLTDADCATLVDVISAWATPGDGYVNGRGPLQTAHQEDQFAGITVDALTDLVRTSNVDQLSVRLLGAIVHICRRMLERQFTSDKMRLYVTYAQLVKRSGAGISDNTRKFSHPIHADNCNLHLSGTCERAEPSYIWRDYTVILYLNDDFKGGDFVFVGDPKGEIVQETVKPKCGRLLAFSSGKENMHGVKTILNGTRYSLGIWFTHDLTYAADYDI